MWIFPVLSIVYTKYENVDISCTVYSVHKIWKTHIERINFLISYKILLFKFVWTFIVSNYNTFVDINAHLINKVVINRHVRPFVWLSKRLLNCRQFYLNSTAFVRGLFELHSLCSWFVWTPQPLSVVWWTPQPLSVVCLNSTAFVSGLSELHSLCPWFV